MFQSTGNVATAKNQPAPLVRLNRWHIARSRPDLRDSAAAGCQEKSREVSSSDGKKPYRVEVGGKIFEGSDTRSLLRLAVEARRAQRSQSSE